MRLLLASVGLALGLVAARPEVAASGEALGLSAARRKPAQPRQPPAPKQAPASEFIRGGQRALKRAGYDPGALDGQLGPSTREALRRFQGAHGLPITGEFDVPTLTRLVDHGLQP